MSNFFTADLAARLFRTGLQVAGTMLATKGYVDEQAWATISGASLTLFTTVFTIISANKAAK